jgi:N-ethylmaleimide reductase
MNTLSLFDRHRIGTLPLKNRIVMAPMTRRARCSREISPPR